jgi:hypothetical protein
MAVGLYDEAQFSRSYGRRAGDRSSASSSNATQYNRRLDDCEPALNMTHHRRRASDAHHHETETDLIEVSVVMPCLNEEASVGICVAKALAGLASSGKIGEVIVSDNGSTDNSVEVARAAGATVIQESARGYGNAYMTGFGAARDKVGEGYDYVLGSRFGGEIRQGAMTWSHRYIGNPVLTAVLNRFFGLKSSDAHSGMRAFTREALDGMDLKCEGMEFASEIVVKAARANLRVAEVPIVYHPRIGESKLNSLRDGWRHLRFLLLLSPVYLFILPGLIMLALGVLGEVAVLSLHDSGSSTNVSVLCALLSITGVMTVIFGVFTQSFLQSLGFQRSPRLTSWFDRKFSLERNLAIALGTIFVGLATDLSTWATGMSAEVNGAKWDVFSLTLVAAGLVIAFGSFFLSIFRVQIHGTSA